MLTLIGPLTGVLLAAAPDTRLIDAVRRVDVTAVRRLIEQKIDVNITQPDGATALHWAAHRNDVAIADLLIGAGAKVDAADEGGVTPLGLAALNASPAMAERLLKAGANPNAGRESPVFSAARSGSVVSGSLGRLARVSGSLDRLAHWIASSPAKVVRCMSLGDVGS